MTEHTRQIPPTERRAAVRETPQRRPSTFQRWLPKVALTTSVLVVLGVAAVLFVAGSDHHVVKPPPTPPIKNGPTSVIKHRPTSVIKTRPTHTHPPSARPKPAAPTPPQARGADRPPRRALELLASHRSPRVHYCVRDSRARGHSTDRDSVGVGRAGSGHPSCRIRRPDRPCHDHRGDCAGLIARYARRGVRLSKLDGDLCDDQPWRTLVDRAGRPDATGMSASLTGALPLSRGADP